MFAIVVGSDRFCSGLVVEALKRLGIEDVRVVQSVHTLLVGEGILRRAGLVVTERRLPWAAHDDTDEQFKVWLEGALRRYPDLIPADFETADSGERLLRWMRKSGMNMPVLFYTHSGQDMISNDVSADLGVYYCQKSSSTNDLDEVLREILARVAK